MRHHFEWTARALFSLVLASLLWTGGIQSPSVRIPDTPAGRQFAAWLEVFNSGQQERFEDFLSHYKNPSAHDVNRDLEFRQMTGGFELRKVEQSSPTTSPVCSRSGAQTASPDS